MEAFFISFLMRNGTQKSLENNEKVKKKTFSYNSES